MRVERGCRWIPLRMAPQLGKVLIQIPLIGDNTRNKKGIS